jgi:hypothetical protein
MVGLNKSGEWALLQQCPFRAFLEASFLEALVGWLVGWLVDGKFV